MIDLLAFERANCLRYIREGGPGWVPYTLRKAESLERVDPKEYRGIVATVEAEIAKAGHQAVDAARRAAKWMESP